jgi:15-cis-phytoene synthase
VTPSLATAYEDCRRITRESGSSFYAGMRLLPPDRRLAIFAIYALARRIDDVADSDLPLESKLVRLSDIRTRLERIDSADDAVFVALSDVARRFPVPLDAFLDLLEGAEADSRGRRYETFLELEHYCRCVAGSIGRLALGVFDTSDRSHAERLADDLGVALQLGNILRDLREDLDSGRMYVPTEDLARFGCSVADDGLRGDVELVVAFEAERALAWLERGLRLVPLLDRRSAWSVLGMTGPYRRLLERLAMQPELALGAHVSLPRWEKRWAFVRSVLGAAA